MEADRIDGSDSRENREWHQSEQCAGWVVVDGWWKGCGWVVDCWWMIDGWLVDGL